MPHNRRLKATEHEFHAQLSSAVRPTLPQKPPFVKVFGLKLANFFPFPLYPFNPFMLNSVHMSKIFSGIQPSGVIHIGNYIGAIEQFVKLQDKNDAVFCIVDYHAITAPQNPKELNHNILSLAAIYLAAGIDPKKAILFQQSAVDGHTELAWIFETLVRMSELERMTQYKDKALNHGENIGVGLFAYPCLMAADILLYDTDVVPVGEDQVQHVELARDIAKRFNNQFGETFVVPELQLKKAGARIMGLDDPANKMSKSAPSEKNYIAMTDSDELIRKKIKSAVTDSGSTIEFSKDRPALANLITIMSAITDKSPEQIVKDFEGQGYGHFKEALAEELINFITPIRTRYEELMAKPDELKKILADGAKRAEKLTDAKMKQVHEKMGLRL